MRLVAKSKSSFPFFVKGNHVCPLKSSGHELSSAIARPVKLQPLVTAALLEADHAHPHGRPAQQAAQDEPPDIRSIVEQQRRVL